MISSESEFSKKEKQKGQEKRRGKKYGSFASLSLIYEKKKQQAKNNCKEATKQAVI